MRRPASTQSAVWGLGRVAALELPAQWGGLVDVHVDGDVSRLAAVLGGDEAEVEIRAEGVFARRYDAAAPTEAMWEPHGTVIVTGGTGALGTHVARDLKARGVEKIVLVSRRGLDAPGAAALREELGAEIVACDVADRAAVAELLGAHSPNAIVHTAGVLSDGVLEGLAPERFADVFRSKVASALVLDELTRSLELDAFVLFSSVAGALGNPGQANYAAANAVLDAIARDRRAFGLRATSIAWGAWAGAGMAETVDAHGITMRPDLAVAEMWRAAAEDAPTVAIAILPERKPKARKVAVSGDLLEVVRAAVASVLGYAGPHAVGVDKEFRDLGFDSLTAVELRNQLSAETGQTLPASLVYDYPTPRRLADHLRGGAVETEVTSARADEPIAIVGMACRFPGDVNTPDELWQLLVDGHDGMGAFPVDRDWDVESVLATSVTREAGFLAGSADFDPAFFGISPREAMAMDPQQRFLLEATWEALERVGVDPLSLRGSQTGVFVGTNGQDYATLLTSSAEDTEGHAATGLAASVISGRLSYTFGFEGPAVTVDTACSASLVAMHLAVQALRGGECSLAVSGGATIMTTPYAFAELTRQGALAANGRSKAFSDDADGAGWSEGVGMVVMERLSDAVRNGHQVLAVIRGSAVNQDGASNGLTAPNGPSQQRVIRSALANAGLSVGDVDVVEAHGTGTALGDPIEAQALINTYGAERSVPLWLGSVKSNIGHTQAAAGVAGVIKMVLALRHRVLPRTLHVSAPSSHIDWSAGTVELLTEAREWEANGHARRAGVSAFGISGTNAHMILEEAPGQPELSDLGDTIGKGISVPPRGLALVFSAKSPASLRAQIDLVKALDADPADVGFSLLTTRSRFDHRAVLIGDEVVEGVAQDSAPVFIFPGQGSQWHGMAVELLDQDETFRQSMTECDQAIGRLVDWSVIDVLRGDAELLERIEILQPTLFAVMVSLARTWRANGVEPAAVVGHSQGEIAAAHVAGALSLGEAAKIVVLRSQLFADELVGNGAVASVALPVEDTRKLIERWPVLSIAGVNSPTACTVAGALQELEEFVELCVSRDIRARVVASTVASHGPQVEPLREKLLTLLGTITPRETDIAFYSTVKAERIDTRTLDADYWYENARRPIEFVAITKQLIEDGYRVFVESSPHPVLTMSAQATAEADGTEIVTVGSLRRDQGGQDRFTTSLAEAWVAGLEVDWRYPGGKRIDLPTYPFSRSRFWPKAAPVKHEADSAFWQLVDNGDLAGTLNIDAAAANAVLPALTEWRAKQKSQSAVDSWRYRDAWQLLRGVQATGINGTWLAAVPEHHDEWADKVLETFGDDVVKITVTPNAERALLATELVGIEPVGVISLLGTDNNAHAEFADTPLGLALNVLLVQALGDVGSTAPFWAVTKQAISTGATDHVLNPGQVALWGLGRVAALDLPRRWGGLVDLPETIDGQVAQGLVAAITNGGGEDQLAVRETGVYGRRLVPAQRAPKRTEWTPCGTVLITGGTGALGGHVARWVAERGAEHVLLTSRRGDQAPGAAALKAELETLGARVTIAACDASDRTSLKAVIDSVDDLRAVVHAAGIVEGNAPTDTLGMDQLDRLLRAKMTSAWNLHDLTGELDAFILFSSGAASWGSGAQPAYAASNAYLDGLAHFRRAQGLPATSVAWGAWADSGMASENEEGAEQLRRRGVHTMKPELAIIALQQAVEDGHTSLTITNMDWEKFAPSFTAARPSPLLTGIPSVRKALEEPETTDSGLKERLLALPEAERGRTLLDLVRMEAAATLGFESAEAFGPARAFRDVGFDSVTAVDLRNRLKAVTGVALPATLVFDYPTPQALAQFIRGELLGEQAAVSNDPDAHIRETLASISISRLRKAGLLDLVLQLAQDSGENNSAPSVVLAAEAEAIDDMDGEALLRLAIGDAMN